MYPIDCILRGAYPLVRRRACSQLWQHETQSFLHSMSGSSTNCKNAQRTFKNKLSGAIGVAGVAHGKSSMRLCKRKRRMKPAWDGSGARYGGRAMRPIDRANIQKQTVRSDWRGRSRTNGKSRRSLRKRSLFHRADETGWEGHGVKCQLGQLLEELGSPWGLFSPSHGSNCR